MQDLRTMTMTQLVDLLAYHTSSYLRMIAEGSSEEDYARSNLTIRAIQQEIEARKKAEQNTRLDRGFYFGNSPEYSF